MTFGIHDFPYSINLSNIKFFQEVIIMPKKVLFIILLFFILSIYIFAQVNIESYDLNSSGNGIVIKKMSGGGKIVIPEMIEGYPVVEIGNGQSGLGILSITSSNRSPVEIVFPRTIIKINDYAFFNNSYITSVTFVSGSQLKEIGYNAFWGCRNLVAINLPVGLEIIGEEAFQNCTLRSIIFPSGLRSIGFEAFDNNRLTEVTIPEGIEIIYNETFSNNRLLKSVVLPKSLKEIRSDAFKNCVELTDVIIPATITTLRFPGTSFTPGNNAFVDCGKLKIAVKQRLRDLSYPGVF